MTDVTIWHNTKCSKSRATLDILRERGHQPRIVHYLVDTPGADELRRILGMLGCEPRALIRTRESRYRELGLAHENDDEALIHAMIENPILIQRPIVICGDRVAIGRPPENVLAVLQ